VTISLPTSAQQQAAHFTWVGEGVSAARPAAPRETSSKLRAEDLRLLSIGLRKSPVPDRFRLGLTEMEARTGLRFSLNPIENFLSGASLIHFRHGLRVFELLLSLRFGEKGSFLWVITQNTLSAYPVAAKERVGRVFREFRIAVETGRPETEVQSGRRIDETLFGRLRQEESQRPEGLLCLDNTLFELPFAALIPQPQPVPRHPLAVEHLPVVKHPPVVKKRSREIVYLAEMHSLQVVPGSLLLRKDPEKPIPDENDGRFVAVRDPVYYAADPRWIGRNTRLRPREQFRKGSSDDLTRQFNPLSVHDLLIHGLPKETEGETSVRAWAWARAGPDRPPGTNRQIVLEDPARGGHQVAGGVR
jgi:hypothetical protein